MSDTYRTQLDPITALYEAKRADVALVLGTSMNVQGAASYPDKTLKNGGKLIIVNLQAHKHSFMFLYFRIPHMIPLPI